MSIDALFASIIQQGGISAVCLFSLWISYQVFLHIKDSQSILIETIKANTQALSELSTLIKANIGDSAK